MNYLRLIQKVRLLFISILTSSFLSCNSNNTSEYKRGRDLIGLFPVVQNGKYGYINRNGEIIINHQFDFADYFYEGLALVSIGNKSGFIDRTGQIVINPQFDWADNFSEGMAAVRINNLTTIKFKNIVKTESLTLQERLTRLKEIYEPEGKFGYIDKTGKIIIDPIFDEVDNFSEGLAKVKLIKYGFINKDGKIVINPIFDNAGDFSEGLARVKVGDNWGYISKKMKIVISPKFNWKLPFEKQPRFVIRPQFDYADDFHEGLARVGIGIGESGRVGYIDKTGKYIINPLFTIIDYTKGKVLRFQTFEQFDEYLGLIYQGFSEGLASVTIGGKCGFINKTGDFVINPQFDDAYSFSEGLATVLIGDKWGYIDKTGKSVIPPQFDWAFSFSKGLAQVKIEERIGYIDKTGKYIWEPTK